MGTVARAAKAGGGSNYNSGQTIDPAEVNTDFNTLYTEVNGLLDDGNVETATLPGAKSLRFTEISDPSSPASNDLLLYAADDGAGVSTLATKDSAGTVTRPGYTFLAGTSTTAAKTSGVLTVDTTAVGNVGGGTDDLISYTLPANVLSANGKGLRITAWGSLAANANGKSTYLVFGATSLTGIGGSLNNRKWFMQGVVVRTGAATQDSTGVAWYSGTSPDVTQYVSTPAETLSSSVVVKCTGAATADNDIVQEGLVVEVLN